jgi:protein SCO1/2
VKSKSAAIALMIWLTSVALLWGLAFAPMPEKSPDWLLAAKYICFGKTESGLPQAWGWLNLIGSPLIMLTAIFIVWSPWVVNQTIQNSFKNKIQLFIIIIYIVFFAYLFYSLAKKVETARQIKNITYEFSADPLPKNYRVTNKSLPHFQLVGENGKTMTEADIKGPAILTFAYFHCETICPLLIENVVKAEKMYSTSAAKNAKPNISLYIITLDPWRDKPGQLEQMVAKWNLPQNAHVLTSNDPDQTIETLNKLEVERTRNEKTGDIIHEGLVYVVNGQGKIHYTLINPGVMRMVDALEKIR